MAEHPLARRGDRLPVLRVPAWEAIPHLVHGFLGRRGGVSRGPFAELNLSDRVGDLPETVDENWQRASRETGGLRRAYIQQVHGEHVVTVDDLNMDAGEADAAVTQRASIALGVLTADCVPILLVAPQHHVVAAVHAGWRGTLAGIARRAVQHIERTLGARPADLRAALGPSIGGCCYEVDRSIAEAIEQAWGAMCGAVRPDAGAKAWVDLRRVNAAILERAGVPPTHILNVGPCTRCTSGEYFSHRGANGRTGRQWSFIGWRR